MIEEYDSKNHHKAMFETPNNNNDVKIYKVIQSAHKRYQQTMLNITRHHFHHDKTEIPMGESMGSGKSETVLKHKNDVSISDLVAKFHKASSQYQTCVRVLKKDQELKAAAAA
jgi:flagellar basal body rod protein FlgB